MSNGFSYALKARDGKARSGVITTPRGDIRTPAFMPVGTAGTVKAMLIDWVRSSGADIVLANTYHLMLRPGAERMSRFGGLHGFMNWTGPILTDSGGFQVMSLAKLRRISEDGVTFQSHIDGAAHELSPERAIEIQCAIGSDIQMVLDECTPFPCERDEAKTSMERSMRWAQRSKDAFETKSAPGQTLFGIVQGGIYPELREASARALTDIEFEGYAIGGLAVGEGTELMLETLATTTPLLPEDRPRYLMGVGTPLDLVNAVAEGVDMFDCVMPTRSGRHGQAFTWAGKLNLRNAVFAEDMRPLDETSTSPAARDYSRAYLHHLFKANELLGPMLTSWANIQFYQDLMAAIRLAIEEGRFEALADDLRVRWTAGD
jgi:queuine tRNA-ribosyltransferase